METPPSAMLSVIQNALQQRLAKVVEEFLGLLSLRVKSIETGLTLEQDSLTMHGVVIGITVKVCAEKLFDSSTSRSAKSIVPDTQSSRDFETRSTPRCHYFVPQALYPHDCAECGYTKGQHT